MYPIKQKEMDKVRTIIEEKGFFNPSKNPYYFTDGDNLILKISHTYKGIIIEEINPRDEFDPLVFSSRSSDNVKKFIENYYTEDKTETFEESFIKWVFIGIVLLFLAMLLKAMINQ